MNQTGMQTAEDGGEVVAVRWLAARDDDREVAVRAQRATPREVDVHAELAG